MVGLLLVPKGETGWSDYGAHKFRGDIYGVFRNISRSPCRILGSMLGTIFEH